MATKFLRKIILEELQKVLKEEDASGQYQMPRKSAADRLKSQAFDYYAGKIKNSDVGQLQQSLIDLGYEVMPKIPGKPQMPDGYIGRRTLAAAREVLQMPNLTADDLASNIKIYKNVAANRVKARSGVADYLKQSDEEQAKLDKQLQQQKDKEAAETEGIPSDMQSGLPKNIVNPEDMSVKPIKRESIAREVRKLLRSL